MDQDPGTLAWNLFTELRKELVSTQERRVQVLGFKITLVGTSLGIIASNIKTLPAAMLVIPAFAAIFFDYLIQSLSFSIKRIGYYCRTKLEPVLREAHGFPDNTELWEEFLQYPSARRKYAAWGDMGLTYLTVVIALVALFFPFTVSTSLPLLVALIVLTAWDVRGSFTARNFPGLKSSASDRVSEKARMILGAGCLYSEEGPDAPVWFWKKYENGSTLPLGSSLSEAWRRLDDLVEESQPPRS
jgi:hypothetical protein